MRRIFLFLFALMLALPALGEGSAFVEDCVWDAQNGTEVRYTLPDTGEAELALLRADGKEISVIIPRRTLLGGAHVLRLGADFFSPALSDGVYTLALRFGGATYTASLTVGNPARLETALAPAKADDPSKAITPALRSEYDPHHTDCFWCTPMDISDEAAVWAMLTAPMTVVNIDQRSNTVLYAEPDAASEPIAMITGASQGVHVVETLENGWSLVETYSSSFFDSKVKNWNGFATGYIQTAKLKQVKVNQQYGIVIDKLTQELYFFKDGHLETTLAVSTGLYNERQPYNETRSGEFLIISFTGRITSDRLLCDYALRYNDDDYLHEVPYSLNGDGSKNYKNCEAKLGTRASHGCIRVQRLTNADGYKMSTIYDLIKSSTNATKLNVKMVIWEDYQGRQIPIPADDTLLYYNPNGGTSYHSTDRCPGVRDKYLPLTAFTYGELENAQFASFTRCANCQPPLRKAEIERINREHENTSPGEIMSLIGK